MRPFEEIFQLAADRKGGETQLNELLEPPKHVDELISIRDDRWLSSMTKSIFQAGFNWKVVDRMWPGFEEAFNEFDIHTCAMLNEDDFDTLVSNKKIVRHGTKIRSVQENAAFLKALTADYGSAAKAIAQWPETDFVGLLEMLKKRGSRLGGTTAQYFLRDMNRDGFILSRDVVARLIAEGVVDKPPTSKAAMKHVQEAFNIWMGQSSRSLKEISRVLAMSIG
ncbi:MAG: DNA-3-methyladenine glycosylase I [Pseudomonadota bacterium]